MTANPNRFQASKTLAITGPSIDDSTLVTVVVACFRAVERDTFDQTEAVRDRERQCERPCNPSA